MCIEPGNTLLHTSLLLISSQLSQSVGQSTISDNHPTSSFPFREGEQKEVKNRKEENMTRRRRGKWGLSEGE